MADTPRISCSDRDDAVVRQSEASMPSMEADGGEAILWRIALQAAPAAVFSLLDTQQGRESFWAEEAPEEEGRIRFVFPDGERLEAEILERQPPRRFALRYFEGSRVVFTVAGLEEGGAMVTLEETGLTPATARENAAGWVSVLLNLKAVADFGADLRNHDRRRAWDRGFVDN